MVTTGINQAKSEEFAGKLIGIINSGFLTPLISVGHRTGLFDKLAELPASTSVEVADAAGLNERYVREWLAAMTVGGIVEYEPASQKFALPPEHAVLLTRAAGQDNMAYFAQYIALVGNVEDKVVESFQNGGGVPYSAYPKFQELQAGESAALYDNALLQAVIPLVPGLHERLESGIDAADVGTGQGHAVNVLARAFPKSRFTGFDFSDEGVTAGIREAASWRLSNATFKTHDVSQSVPGLYDLITAFDMVHDLARPADLLRNAAGALKPGGIFLVMDIAGSSHIEKNLDHPFGPALYASSVLHCMTVSLSQGGEGLGTMWGEEKAQDYLKAAGFTSIDVRHFETDPMHVFYICRRS